MTHSDKAHTAEQLARRIAETQVPDGTYSTHAMTLVFREVAAKGALAAIIETQRLDADEAESIINEMRDNGESDLRTARHLVCSAIRAGHHYGKDEG